MKIRLGYTAATSMSLINDEYVAEDPNVNSSLVMSHTYEVYLLPPGEGLISLDEEQPPPTKSEAKMKKDEPTQICLTKLRQEMEKKVPSP